MALTERPFPGTQSRYRFAWPRRQAGVKLGNMSPTSWPPARWPAHVLVAAARLRGASGGAADAARAELWPLLHAALFASLRSQAGRIARVADEDLEDLASQKSLELLLRAEEGAWDPGGRGEHEVAGYLARVARHALIDFARRRGREAPAPDDADAWTALGGDRVESPASPEDHACATEFAAALRACVGALAPRARLAWFLRAFLERPSREIATRLGVTTAHVDVIVQRARAELRGCMLAKGHPDAALRPGAFVDVWASLAEGAGGVANEEAEHDGRG